MASLGHIAIGMAAASVVDEGRPARWSAMAWWAGLSLLPDADVVGFALGVQYGDPWGHRGATHSLALSAGLGLAIGFAARQFGRSVLRTAGLAVAVLASHALLDTMTDGGLGCALLWPFDLTRYFAPWRPIPVAPIGLAFLSGSGAFVTMTELVLFTPALLFALRSRRVVANRGAVAGVLALWLLASWLIVSTDPVREAIVGLVLRDDTAYASNFSEAGFRAIRPGAPQEMVRRLVGAPLEESWLYPPKSQAFESAMERSASAVSDECMAVRIDSGTVSSASPREVCGTAGIVQGLSSREVAARLGAPPESCWRYSSSPGNRHYRLRVVCFRGERVETVIRRWE